MPVNGGHFLSREHTVLHEVRELLERIFEDLGHPIANRNTPESRAEQFAATARIALVPEFSKDFFGITGTVRDPTFRLGPQRNVTLRPNLQPGFSAAEFGLAYSKRAARLAPLQTRPTLPVLTPLSDRRRATPR